MPFQKGNDEWKKSSGTSGGRKKNYGQRYRWNDDEKSEILEELLTDSIGGGVSEIAPSTKLADVPDNPNAAKFGVMGSYRTGFRTLDRMTLGFNPGDYMVIGAGTNQGKTQLSTYIAKHVAHAGTPVLYLSRELMNDEMKKRFEYIADGTVPDNIYIPPTNRLSPAEMLEVIRNFKQDHGDCLVIVDHLHAFARGEHLTERLGELSESLRELAQDLHIPILALSQLNRQPYKEDSGPANYHLKESGYIEDDAYSILMCWRVGPAFYVKLTKSRHQDIGTLKDKVITLRSAHGYITDDWANAGLDTTNV